MSSSKPKQRFKEIIEHIEMIEEFTNGFREAAVLSDKKTEYAVKMALMNIGEAGKKLGTLAEELTPEQPWRQIHGFCNRLRHQYDEIDLGILCNTIKNRLLPLKDDCVEALHILQQEKNMTCQQKPLASKFAK